MQGLTDKINVLPPLIQLRLGASLAASFISPWLGGKMKAFNPPLTLSLLSIITGKKSLLFFLIFLWQKKCWDAAEMDGSTAQKTGGTEIHPYEREIKNYSSCSYHLTSRDVLHCVAVYRISLKFGVRTIHRFLLLPLPWLGTPDFHRANLHTNAKEEKDTIGYSSLR